MRRERLFDCLQAGAVVHSTATLICAGVRLNQSRGPVRLTVHQTRSMISVPGEHAEGVDGLRAGSRRQGGLVLSEPGQLGGELVH